MKQKIGWIVWNDINNPSTRIQVLNIHNELKRIKEFSFVKRCKVEDKFNFNKICSFLRNNNITVLIIHKFVFYGYEKLIKYCKSENIHVLFYYVDPIKIEIDFNLFDTIVTHSEVLKDMIEINNQDNIIVIPDAHETPRELYKRKYISSNKYLNLSYVSSRRLSDLPFKLTNNLRINTIGSKTVLDVIGNYNYRLFKFLYGLKNKGSIPYPTKTQWKLYEYLDVIMKSDIAILPENNIEFFYKSNNRLTQLMSIGMPVVAYPLPSYKEIIIHGHNGFLVETRKEWEDILKNLEDYKLRERVGKQARDDIYNKYSIETIAVLFLKKIKSLVLSHE